MKETDLAWAAGIIDGEGCISIQRCYHTANRPPCYTLFVTAGMVHKPTAERLRRLFGGCLYMKKPRNPKHQVGWYWYVASRKAAEVLEIVYPYLFTKHKQAGLGIRFSKRQLVPRQYRRKPIPQAFLREREKLFWQIREGNRKGFRAVRKETA